MYVLNRWPQTNVVKYSWCIGLAKYTRASTAAKKTSLLFSIIIKIILSYAIIRIYSPSSIFESPKKKQAFDFLRKCLFKIPLRRETDNAISYNLISSNIVK